MINIFYIFIGIIVLFFIFLIAKGFSKKFKDKFCAICAAVSVTWICLLVLYWLGIFENKVIIALLMGQSILGVYYIAEKKAKQELQVFRLPFLLTLIAFGYSLLTVPGDLIMVILLLLALWTFFIFLYLYRNNKNMRSFVKKIVECCKKW